MSGVYPAGTTCSNPTGATYSASYDSWGNLTSRTYAGVTATLTYDVLDHLVKWDAGTSNKEWYAYDASGNRVLLRNITGGTTRITTYPFGLEEHLYNSLGSTLGNTYYYTLGGRLIGELTGANTLSTQFFLTDDLGSVLATFNATAGSAAVLGNQVYGPYGTQRYTAGPMGTAKGYTGQYADPSGLDYYNARYYDPVVGLFLSADTVQGNAQGMDPYSYVDGNPETLSDPSGQYIVGAGGQTYHPGSPYFTQGGEAYSIHTGHPYNGNGFIHGWRPGYGANAPRTRPIPHSRIHVVPHSPPSFWDRLGNGVHQIGGWLSNIWHTLTGPTPSGEANNPLGMPCGPLTLSFAPMTKVATSQGEKAISSLHPGERVWAYNPKTHKMELEPVVHVWINHDNDLVDVTIASTIPAHHGKAAHKTSEVVHTNQKHPFLTMEKGFVPVSQLRVGMHVMKAAGGAGIITMLQAIPGTMTMYNLEIAQDHTYTVGEGEWIVHNCGGGSVGNVGPAVVTTAT